MRPSDEQVAAVTEKLVAACDTATVEQFRNRLEVNVIIAAYIEKRFRQRFPAEYAAWLEAEEQRLTRGEIEN